VNHSLRRDDPLAHPAGLARISRRLIAKYPLKATMMRVRLTRTAPVPTPGPPRRCAVALRSVKDVPTGRVRMTPSQEARRSLRAAR